MTKTETIKKAVYNLCLRANTILDADAYSKISAAYEKLNSSEQRTILSNILLNAKISYETKRPLCQDTGQVIVFLEIGQDAVLEGEDLTSSVNEAVEKCYRENFFRKSVVKNAIFDRINTTTNTPAIIHTEIVGGNKINIYVLIKGAGSENKSSVIMALPTNTKDELGDIISNAVLSSGINSCPPLFIGLGIGQNLEGAALLSKKAFFKGNSTSEEAEFAQEIKDKINQNAPVNYKGIYALDVKILSASTHIASMPVGITINCHSVREASCTIDGEEIIYQNRTPEFKDTDNFSEDAEEIFSYETEKIRSLKEKMNILLSGEIFVARDAAHKKLADLTASGKPLPFDLKDKIILYAGPCPAKDGEIIGPIGPTTAGRMDKYSFDFYNKGLRATIGKGSRSLELADCIRQNKGVYFSLQGGIASLLKTCIKKSEIIAFPELGAEAVYRLEVEKLPVTVEISSVL